MKTQEVHRIGKPRKNYQTGEWIVPWLVNGRRNEDRTYYTDDRKDAEDTSRLMQAQAERFNHESNDHNLQRGVAGQQMAIG